MGNSYHENSLLEAKDLIRTEMVKNHCGHVDLDFLFNLASYPSHSISINREVSIEKLIKNFGFKHADLLINDEHFPVEEGPKEIIMKRFSFVVASITNRAIKKLSEVGFRMATLSESLHFYGSGFCNPEATTVIFGSVWENDNQDAFFPVLRAGKKDLSLYRYEEDRSLPGSVEFLIVKK